MENITQKWKIERTEDDTVKKHILEINKEHPHYSDEVMSIFLRDTSWGKEMDAVVTEAHEYLEKIEASLDDARKNGDETMTDMYEYLHELVYADFCRKHTEMEEAFCIWSHNVLGWSIFERYGVKNPFRKGEFYDKIFNAHTAGETVTLLRNELHMSRTDFSKKFEIPVRTLEDWEAGKRTPPAYVLNLLKIAVEKNLENDW